MGFNYLQTDDRDDYFTTLSTLKNYKRYALKRGRVESKWLQRWGIAKILMAEANFSKPELKTMHISEMINVLTNLGYTIHEEKLPYLTGHPLHVWE